MEKFISHLSDSDRDALCQQATEIYGRHGFQGHACVVSLNPERQELIVRVDTADDLHCVGRDEADLALERPDLFFEREARNAEFACRQRRQEGG